MKLPPLLLFAALAIAPPVAAGPGATVGVWKLDDGSGERAADSSGKGRHGTVTGARWAAGLAGGALEFAGPDYSGPFRPPGTFVRIPASESLAPGTRLDVAVAVFPTSYPLAWGGLVEKGDGYAASFRLVLLRNGRVRGAIGNEHLSLDSPSPLPLAQWSQLRLSWDGKTLTLRVDNQVVAERPAATQALTSVNPIEFGRRFTGRLDDIRISF